MTEDEKYLWRCILLAKLGSGSTEKNPLVGAVLVHNNKIIGEGYHEIFGEAHAEVNCLNSVSDENKKYIHDATLYVNLEPCNHSGKTPPCTNLILEANIKKVVIGTADENPLVASKGIAKLLENNVEIVTSVLENKCHKLNKSFFTNQKYNRAFVKLKWAETANGFIGEAGQQIAISGERTNIINHKHRTQVDGILVGYNTAKNDNPQLNARHWNGKQPSRIFIDWQCTLPKEIVSKLGQRNIVLNNIKNANENEVEYIQVEKSANAIAKKLLELNICSVLIEGGAKTHELFIKENIWDEAIVIQGAAVLKNGIPSAKIREGKLLNRKSIHADIISHYSNSPFLK